MAFYIPKYGGYSYGDDDESESSGSSRQSKTSKSGFYSPSYSSYESASEKAEEKRLEDEAKRKAEEEERKRKEEEARKAKEAEDFRNKAGEVAGNVGRFFLEGTSKLANQGAGVVGKLAVNVKGEAQKALGNKEGGERTIREGEKALDENLLQKGKGLFGAGGIYESVKALNEADLGEVARKTAGTTLESASEILPIGAGVKIAKGTGKLSGKIAEGALQGAAGAAVGDVGSQIVEGKKFDGGELLQSIAAGGVLGGATGGIFGKLAANKAKKAEQAVINADEIAPLKIPNITDNTPSAIEAPSVNPVNELDNTLSTPRAEKYVPDATKLRISEAEAKEKLQNAGYTTDESIAILSDALPDKGLSMPGSPKNIGLNEDSIVKAAADFDNTNMSPAALSNNTAAPQDNAIEGANLKSLQSMDGSAELGTSKLATSVQDKAVQEKLITRTEAEASDLPTYNKANMKQQAEYATNLIKTSPQDAVEIAMGRKAPPEHVLPQMVYNAVEDHAMKIGGEKGGKLLKDLAKSKQVSNLTVMAQNVRAAAERDPHSPVTMINEVRLARAEAAKRRGRDVSKAEKADVTAIKKATPKVKKEDWSSFIESLNC